jgi:pyridoxal phosphate enzyme (YggS family)
VDDLSDAGSIPAASTMYPAAGRRPCAAPAAPLSAPLQRAPFRLPLQSPGTTLPRPVNATPASLASNLASVRDRITAAERRSGRPAGSVTLIGVVKTLPAETIAAAVALGLRDLGENKVQEAEGHQRAVGRTAARWHMIGHLQRNKAGRAVQMFDVVHGVDDAGLAAALARRVHAAGRHQPVLIEVNVSDEASKFGVSPDALAALAEQVAALPELRLLGLMTVGAPVARPEDARPGFARLRALRDSVAKRLGTPLPELSMGMSGDYEVAIEEGATMVRVGTALFGARNAHGGV